MVADDSESKADVGSKMGSDMSDLRGHAAINLGPEKLTVEQ